MALNIAVLRKFPRESSKYSSTLLCPDGEPHDLRICSVLTD